MEKYFGAYVQQLGLSFQDLMSLGRQNPADESEPFCMTVLAIRLSAHTNAAAAQTAPVPRGGWQGIWPDVPESDIPITHITNGVHIPSWISFEMSTLYQRYIGPKWFEDPDSKRVWERIDRTSTPNRGAPTSAGASAWWRSPAGGSSASSSGAALRARSRASPPRCSTRGAGLQASPAGSPPTSGAT